MRLLLLGATGFLGRHVAEEARGRPQLELVRQARREPGTPGEWLIIDLLKSDDAALRDLLAAAGPDAIVNCTGATGGEPEFLEALNVQLVARLLAAAAAAAPDARFVQLGSAAEYGATPTGMGIPEEQPPAPLSDYGRTKLAGSQLVISAAEAGSTNGVVLRVFNPVGAGMSEASLPGRAAAQMRRALGDGAAAIRLGPLDDHRDFIDARDVAGAVLEAAGRSRMAPILNVGTGVAVRSRDLVHELAAIAAFSGEVVEEDLASDRSSSVPWQQAQITRIHEELGWRPRRSLTEALHALWGGG